MPRAPDTEEFRVGRTRLRMLAGDRVVDSVRSGRPFEPETLDEWSRLCTGFGATVVDVGAYTGLFTISARLAGCRCLPFEPMPDNAARLRQNAALNDVSPQVNTEAVSDAVGHAVITFNPKVAFTSGASLVRKKGKQRAVATLTLDSLKLRHLAALKVDVERAEEKVLAGAGETLRRLRPVVIIEALDAAAEEVVLRRMRGYLYVRRMDGRNMLMVPK